MKDDNSVSGVFLCLNRCYYNTSSSSPCFLYFWEYLSWFFTFPVSQVLKTILSISHRGTDSNSHTSKFSQELLPRRVIVCLCRSVLQTGCLQQQHPWCSGIATPPQSLFHHLPRISHQIGFCHSPHLRSVFSLLYFSKNSQGFLLNFILQWQMKDDIVTSKHLFLLSTSVNFHVWANWRVMSSGVVGNGWKKV